MSAIFLERSVVENITEDGIRKIIDTGGRELKYARLQSYYEGKHDILGRQRSDPTVPNNRLVNNMPKYVTDTITGYFIGNPVAYSSKNDELFKAVQDIFEYNDEQDHNTELAKSSGIKGRCYEMLYFDEDAKLRIVKIEPNNLIMVYDGNTPIAAVRTSIFVGLNGDVTEKVEFWNWREVWYFVAKNGSRLLLEDVQEHLWQDVPFVDYINNNECIGDYEGIMTLVDAYNKVQSNTANIFEYNDDAILTVEGLGDVTSKDVKAMKEDGAIVLDQNGKIDWLLKQVNDTAIENYKDRVFRDMHLFASVPNLADESFGNNLSGVAMDYKLWHLEQVVAIKERKFKKGLQRRIELITRMLNLRNGTAYDYRDIDIQFRRNKPQSLLELSQIVNNLSHDVSRETRLKLLPFIDNVLDEQRLLEEERQAELNNFGGGADYTNLLRAMKQPEKPEQPLPDGTEVANGPS